MKSAPSGVATFVAANNIGFRADLYTLVLADGTVFRWTTCDVDITVGDHTWLASGAVTSRSNLRSTSQLEVDTLEVQLAGAFLLNGKTIALRAVQGYFDEARLQIDHLVGPDLPGALAIGPVLAWYEGRVAAVDPGIPTVRMQVQSELATLTQQLPKFLFQTGCRNAVYDPNCAIAKSAFTLAGTVSAAPTRTAVPTSTAALTAKAAGYFDLGVLAFTSGPLAGIKRSVRSWDGSTLTLALPLPSAPLPGDAFTVYPGCPRTQDACNSKFSNLVHFRGFPHIPTTEGAQ